MPHKQAHSQVQWTLVTEGVSSARLELHRLQHLLSRALKLVDESKQKDHLYQVAGDILLSVPTRMTQLERDLDRTLLALSEIGVSSIEPSLPVEDKALVQEAVESVSKLATLYFSEGE